MTEVTWGVGGVRFVERGLERRYRREILPGDVGLFRNAVLLLAAVPVGFAAADFLLLAPGAARATAIALRFLILAVCLGLWGGLGRIEVPEVFDRLLFAAMLLTAVTLVWLAWTRPPGYLGHAFFDAPTLMVFYVLVRVPLVYQLVPAALLTAGQVLLFVTVKELEYYAPMVSAYVVSLIMANAMGVVASLQLERTRRSEYARLLDEVAIGRTLERALEEIQTLRGILPICAGCKKIRDERGKWRPVEVYVRDRTDADFSHGLCPDCAETYFPDEGG